MTKPNSDVSDWWSTSIIDMAPGQIRFRGHDIQDLIGNVSFPQMIWLMTRGDLPTPEQARLLECALVAAVDPWLPPEWDRTRFRSIAEHIQPRLTTLSEAPGIVDFLFTEDSVRDDASWDKVMGSETAAGLLDAVIEAYSAIDSGAFDAATTKSELERVMEPFGLKLGKAQAPVRVAVTGRTVGPPLFESLEVLGADETLRRLRLARADLVA